MQESTGPSVASQKAGVLQHLQDAATNLLPVGSCECCLVCIRVLGGAVSWKRMLHTLTNLTPVADRTSLNRGPQVVPDAASSWTKWTALQVNSKPCWQGGWHEWIGDMKGWHSSKRRQVGREKARHFAGYTHTAHNDSFHPPPVRSVAIVTMMQVTVAAASVDPWPHWQKKCTQLPHSSASLSVPSSPRTRLYLYQSTKRDFGGNRLSGVF